MSDERPPSVVYRNARRVVIFIVGVSILALGAALLVLPGPGIVTILVGLTVLAVEFAWARRWLNKLQETSGDAARQASRWFRGSRKE